PGATPPLIEDIVALDDYTVRFDLAGPNAFLPDTLSELQSKILPSDIDPQRLATEEFGTGPFILDEYRPGVSLVMKRNPNYWQEGLPYLDEVIVFYMDEEQARVGALNSGLVDVLFEVEASSVSGLEANPNINLSEVTTSGYRVLVMDVRQEPFDNKLVRQAIQAATDREAILQSAMFGHGTVAHEIPIPPTDPHFSNEHLAPPYDPVRAKELLEEAGFFDGIDLTLHTADIQNANNRNLRMLEMALAFKESAAAANIRVEVINEDPATYWEQVWMVAPFVTSSWGPRFPYDAIAVCCTGAVWNESFYQNPEMDALLEQARGQADLQERAMTFGEIQGIFVDDVPRILVGFTHNIMGMQDNVHGLRAHPYSYPLLHETWLETD
ncbi:MAG: hypothetical protein IH861_16615, partial [Chloroflexi bacterium]|nr:hypothetical protein [Chloroflexota bacterium]